MPLSFPSSPTVNQTSTQNGRVYKYAGNNVWELAVFNPVDPRWDLFLPPAPTSLAATAGNAQVSLAWTAPTVLAQTPITDYAVQFSSNGGSSWTTFSDGTSTATSATVTGLTNGTAYTFRVAAINGVGTGAYTAATSSVTPGAPTDPLFSSVVLLLHMDGIGATFMDSSSSPKTVTAYGDASQSASQSKWGGKSLALDGTGDYLDAGGSVSSLMGATSDFTLEAWVYLTSGSTARAIVSNRSNSSSDDVLVLGVDSNRQPYFHTTATAVVNGSAALSLNTWSHVALVRSGNDWSLYLDGNRIGTGSGSYNLSNSQSLWIGAEPRTSQGAASPWLGYIDDVRITKAARYSGSTITVPTTAFPDA